MTLDQNSVVLKFWREGTIMRMGKKQSWYNGFDGAKKSRLPNSTFRVPTECTYLISSSQLNLEGSYARNKLKNEKNRPKSHFFGTVRK